MKRLFYVTLLITLIFGVNQSANAQSMSISGQVIDKNDNETLVGTNIVEVDKNGRYLNGTITDINGNYIIKVSGPNATIQVSMMGYDKQLLEVNGRSRINVELEYTSTQLDEITVTGKKVGNDGVKAIRDRGEAVARIELEELGSVMTTSVEEMLQGRIGNVDITSVSGDPGSGLNIRIRGTATLNANNSPLIVINGIPYDTQVEEGFDFASANIEKFGSLIDVAPEDIESIEVLKDAGSTAIWGSKASNGVLMIQTKRGTRSKPIFDYTAKFTLAIEPDPIPMLEGGDYAKLILEEHYNNYSRSNYLNSNNDVVNQIKYDKNWEEYWNYAQNTNWVEEITRKAFAQQNHFSVRGGGEKSGYKVSLGYLDQEGTLTGTGLKKINIGTAFDYYISRNLKFQSDIMYTRYDQDDSYKVWVDGANRDARYYAYKKMPNMSVYVRDTANTVFNEYFTPDQTIQGTASDMPNPVAFANLAVNKKYQDNLRAGFTLNYRISDKITANSIIVLDVFDRKTERFLPYKAIGGNFGTDQTRKASEEFNNKTSIQNMTKLIYTPLESALHDLTLLGQFDVEMTDEQQYQVQTQNSFSEFETSTYGAKNLSKIEGGFSEFRSMGFYGNAFYKIYDKYIFSLGAKLEANSKYSSESRWGVFPAATVAWRISEEPFLSEIDQINDLRLRSSWGISGNSPQWNYLHFNTYQSGLQYSYLGIEGVVPRNMELTSLVWESIEQYNVGLSLFALQNRLNIEFDVYQKTTRNLFQINANIPRSSGFGTYNTNDGKLQNRGLEGSIDYKVISRKDFSLSFMFNFAKNENLVLELPRNLSFDYGNMLENGNYKVAIVPGEGIGGFFGYKFLGVYKNIEETYVIDKDGNQVIDLKSGLPMIMRHGGEDNYEFQAGDSKYEDINKDGVINELDLVYLGNTNPDIMGGFGPRVSYKGLTVNVFLYYRLGQDIINQARIDTENMSGHDNQSVAVIRRWRNSEETDMPRAMYDDGNVNRTYNWLGSSRFVEDGSFIRLKSASITYDFTKEFARKLKLESLRAFFTGYNLFTYTNYTGPDPEVGLPGNPSQLPRDESRTPPSIRYTFGVGITF